MTYQLYYLWTNKTFEMIATDLSNFGPPIKTLYYKLFKSIYNKILFYLPISLLMLTLGLYLVDFSMTSLILGGISLLFVYLVEFAGMGEYGRLMKALMRLIQTSLIGIMLYNSIKLSPFFTDV